MGSNLAKYLLKEDHDVCLVEHDEQVAKIVQDKFDVKVAIGNGADPEILNKVSVSDADIVLAVTSSDEINVIVCSISAYLGAKQQIARVRSSSLKELIQKDDFNHLSFDRIINPEQIASDAIIKIIKSPGVREISDFADGKILLRSIDIPEGSPLCGTKIEDLKSDDFPWPFLIILVIRDGNTFIPRGDALLQPKDRIYAFLPEGSLGEFLTFVNPQVNIAKKIIIYGASDIGKRAASELSGKISDIFLIEDDPQKTNAVAIENKSVKAIHGSASESDILKECGVETVDVFIACSQNDHSNLISAIMAKKMGAKISIITTQQPDYISIADTLDIDAIINPQVLAAYQIVSIVRGKGVRSVVKLMDCDAEALELVPDAGSPITKGQIKTLSFPRNSIVGAVCRGSDVALVNGDTKINAGEKVIAFCQESSSKKLQALFIKKRLF
jgi:trk system potassium uptake protein TrkA